VDTKVFLAFCNSICWFNPLVWIATRKAAEDLELSCDEIVTENMDEAQRRAYAGLLLSSAAPQKGYTTCLSAAAGTLRYRLKNIMTKRRRFPGTVLLMSALFCCTLCFGTVALTDDRGTYTELMLPEDAEIDLIFVQHDENSGLDVINAWDESKLRDILSDIRLEHLTGIHKSIRRPGTMLELVIKNNGKCRYVTLTKELVSTNDNMLVKDYYLVESPVDWETILSALDFDAEKSD
jgi:hypothetical protein